MSELQGAERPLAPETAASQAWEAADTAAPMEPKDAESFRDSGDDTAGDERLEPAEPAESAEPTEVAVWIEPAEPAESAEPAEPTEVAVWIEPADLNEPAEPTESAEAAKAAESADPWATPEWGQPEEPVEPEETPQPVESGEPDTDEGDDSPQLAEYSSDSIEAANSPQSAEVAEPMPPTEVAQPVESGEASDSDEPSDAGDKIQKTVDRPSIENMYFDDGEEIEGLTYGDPINEHPEGRVPLFDGPPTREQTAQGSLNDCGVIASLGAVAGHRPEAIENAVQENPDGTYTVTLYGTERGADSICRATGQRIELRVEPDLPVVEDDPSTPVFAQMEGAAWAAVLEKAMAAVDQTWDDKRANDWDEEWKADTEFPDGPTPVGYERLNQGSSVWEQTEMLTQLTGKDSIVYSFPQGEGAGPALEGHLQQQLADSKPILAATRMLNEAADEEELPYELVPNHVYEVVGAQDGLVHLRNPWGVDDPEEMSTEEFIRNFSDQGWGLYGTLS
ncbi:C2 family cysteine protease [Streptomyces sp. AC495_CC817]|uniref:C2 family cysteine protease n=1 Tax=Streptomyces sp. AC495_CC817 TaxID=2823900 RepID=UPI001C27F1CD|nr:C2 family cysteine protease [Streptomyces sp. AC495_CC817]